MPDNFGCVNGCDTDATHHGRILYWLGDLPFWERGHACDDCRDTLRREGAWKDA